MKAINLEALVSNLSVPHCSGLGSIDTLLVGPRISSDDQIASLKAQGVTHVVDMKMAGETDFADQQQWEAAGIRYRHFPVGNPMEISFEQLKSLEADLRNQSGKTYLYCMSGNRVSGILGRFFFEVCGHPKDRVLQAIERLGIVRPELLQALKQHMDIGA